MTNSQPGAGTTDVESFAQELQNVLRIGAELVRRTAASALSLEPQRGAAAEFKCLQQRAESLAASVLTVRPSVAGPLRNRLERDRQVLLRCDWVIRGQAHTIEAALRLMRGNELSAGAYGRDAARHSATGGWMNVRSAP